MTEIDREIKGRTKERIISEIQRRDVRGAMKKED